MKGFYFKHEAKLKTNKNYKKAHLDRFNTYDLRIRKVKEVVLSILKDMYVKVDDAAKIFHLQEMGSSKVFANKTLELMETYMENLNNDDSLDLPSINEANRTLDTYIKDLAILVLDYNSVTSSELIEGIKGNIAHSGYSFLFNEKKMERYAEEKRLQEARRMLDRQVNEGKAISAMFSNLYSADVEREMLKYLKPVQQEA